MTTRQDMHVHSTFSDGHDSLAANVAEAEALGLAELGCVDHVRVDSDWVADYGAAVAQAQAETAVTLTCGVEAKLLDTSGRLDLPQALPGVDLVYVADHQMPCADGPRHPRELREQIAAGDLSAEAVLESLVTATANSLERRPHGQVVIAHLFSILPKMGIDEADVPPQLLDALAAAAAATGARIEISERWRCPSAATLRPFLARGVPVLLSTDSHRREAIGRYDYVLTVLDELSGRAAGVPRSAPRSPAG